jgi:hypothetical protein
LRQHRSIDGIDQFIRNLLLDCSTKLSQLLHATMVFDRPKPMKLLHDIAKALHVPTPTERHVEALRLRARYDVNTNAWSDLRSTVARLAALDPVEGAMWSKLLPMAGFNAQRCHREAL